MPEVSRLMNVNNVQTLDFDTCRFGHPDKGPMKMLTNSLRVAEKVKPQATSSKGTMQVQKVKYAKIKTRRSST